MHSDENSGKSAAAESISLGTLAFSKNQVAEAANHLEHARGLLQDAGIDDSEELRQCLKTLAEVYSRQWKLEEALICIEALRKLHDCTDYRRTYINILMQMATALDRKEQFKEAEEAFRDTVATAAELLQKNDPLRKKVGAAYNKIKRRNISREKLTSADERVLPLIPAPTPQFSQADTDNNPPRRNVFFAGLGKSGLRRLLQSNVLSLLVSLTLLIFVFKSTVSVPAYNSAPAASTVIAKLDGVAFESCDQRASFCVLDKGQCLIKKPNFKAQCPYTIIDSSWPDLNTLFRGYMQREELWYQITDSVVTDPDRNLLYRADTPEMAIVKQMWWYADFSQSWYQKHHTYPGDAEACLRYDKNFQFLNPFTCKQDSAAIVALKGMTRDPSWHVRPGSGQGQPLWRPGGISCICIDGQKFFVHGCDRAGHPLTSSDPKSYFVIECRDGKNVTKTAMLKESDDTKSDIGSNRRVFVYARPEQEASIRYVRTFSCLLAWVLAILSTLWFLSVLKLKQSKWRKAVSSVVMIFTYCALAGLYLLAFGRI